MRENVTVSKVKHPRYRYRVRYTEAGKRHQKFFKNKTGKGGADEWANLKREELEDLGVKHGTITEAERRAVHSFRELQEKLPDHIQRISLEEVVQDYSERIQRSFEPLTCQIVSDKLITRLKSEGKSKSHTDSLTYRLNPFMAEYGDWMAANVSTEIIDEYLTSQDVAAQTKLHYRRALHQVFGYAIQLRAAPSNPVKDAMKPKVKHEEPGVLTPSQLANLLTAADDDTLPGLAISFFAGLRRSEIERLDWSEIDLIEKHIEIKAGKAKTAQRRFVPISANLKKWLAPLAMHEGNVVKSPAIWRKGIETARSDAKLKSWPHNAGRHSFASYHLAHNQDAGALASALGHPNPAMLFGHYRALVTAKAAKTYWSIKPVKKKNITHIKSA
ncbi:hypothetical protein NT6N_30510 [Oceaniferula spumae]|uniref:Tyr recombinase domain-containing protein n=1 Tax=Oceaniferula spumae TaxID=2979115 RepID=A0AAT9FQ40_9BACT